MREREREREKERERERERGTEGVGVYKVRGKKERYHITLAETDNKINLRPTIFCCSLDLVILQCWQTC